MIGAIASRLLRIHRRLFFLLAAALLLFETFMTLMAAQIEVGPGFLALVRILPEALRNLVESQLSMVSFSGAIAFGFLHPFALICGVAWMVVLGSVPSAERESGFLDLVLARPVPRPHYLAAVALVAASGAVGLPLAQWTGAGLGLLLVQVDTELPWIRYLPAAAGMIPLLLCVGGYTLVFGAWSRRRGTAIGFGVGLTAFFFALDMLAGLWEPLRPLTWFNPFRYYDPVNAAIVPHTPALNPLVLLIAAAASALIALAVFSRQDL